MKREEGMFCNLGGGGKVEPGQSPEPGDVGLGPGSASLLAM